MPYVDPNTVHNPSTGTIAPASWGDVLRDDLEFLVDPPACSVSNSSAVSVSDSTMTTLNANTEKFDNDTMHSTVTNTSRITATTAGRYLFFARVEFAASSTGDRRVAFRLNGTTEITAADVRATNSDPTIVTTLITYALAATDYVEVRVLQNTGGALNVTLSEFAASFWTR